MTQELGGKSPNIVLEDADLEAAVTRGVMHMYNNTGQSCNAPSRMLVPRGLLAQAEAIAAKVTESVVMGPTSEESTTMGPVISKIQWDKIQGLIEAGIAEGAKVVCGGPGLPDGMDRGYYVRPTVFSDVSNDMTVAQQEIFGPVLVMIPYDSEEEAIQIANDTPYGLAGYVQSGDLEHARQVARVFARATCISTVLPVVWTCRLVATSNRVMVANGAPMVLRTTSRSRPFRALRRPELLY